MPDDTICWQCGAELPPVQQVDDGQSAGPQAERFPPPPPRTGGLAPDVQPPPLIVYSALTLLVIIAAGVLLNRLSRPPLVQIAPSEILPAEWVIYTLGEYEMTFSLPPTWHTVEVTTAAETAALATQLEANQQLLHPFGQFIDDLTLRFYAQRNPDIAHSPILIIATSEQLGALSYEEIEAAAEHHQEALSYRLFQQEFIRNSNKSHFALGFIQDDLRCQQQIINGRDTGILFALCAPQRSNMAERETLDLILESFEYLRPQAN